VTDDMEILETSFDEYSDAQPALDLIEYTLDNFMAAASVDAAYGEPVVHGDRLVIPAAEVIGVLGFGVGSGAGGMSPDDEDEDEDEKASAGEAKTNPISGPGGSGSGGGGGGGGSVFSRPVAVVVIGPQGVEVKPVVDVTKIVLASVTAGAFAVGMLLQLLRFQKAVKKLS
jgi:uncharacterized spore protein YtfJ